MEDEMYNRIEKKVDEKIGFYHHLFSYVVVISLLFIVNYTCTPDTMWFYWVALFWGIGLIFNLIKVFLLYDKFDEMYRDKMIKKEMEKIRYN